jgi:LAGLIDADG DNA endonuclease family
MKETLLGTVLGDGYLEPHGKGVRLHINHSERFKSYVDWKHKEFSELQPCNPHRNENNGYPSWHFVTRSHPDLIQLRELFYVDGRKIVPETIKLLFTHPKSLAVWFMDDGTCDKDNGSFLLETQCFDEAGLERLQDVLRDNFGIVTRAHQCGRGRQGKRLYVSSSVARKMATLIESYILPVFGYKLGFPVTTEGFTPEIGSPAERQIYGADQTLAPPLLSGG